jgi:hypothetical protein
VKIVLKAEWRKKMASTKMSPANLGKEFEGGFLHVSQGATSMVHMNSESNNPRASGITPKFGLHGPRNG